MRKYAIILPSFWNGKTGKQIRKMGKDARIVATWLFSNPHSTMIGIYYSPIELIALETGLEVEEVVEAIVALTKIGFVQYDDEHEMVYVPDMAKIQIAEELKKDDNRVKGIKSQLDLYGTHPFVTYFKERYRDVFKLR